MKKLIELFNDESTYLVISDYPEEGKGKNYGIAWYTKKLVEPLAKDYNVRFVVLSERGRENRPKLLQNRRILLLRVFDQKRPTLYPRILTWLVRFNRVRYIDVHSEFCTNGGLKNFLLLIPFLLLIKLTGRHITYFAHNVVLELASLATHLGLTRGSLTLKLLNVALPYYYRILALVVDRFVVLDEVVQKRLSLFTTPSKITLSPLWVEKPSKSPRGGEAKKKLGIERHEFLLLSFGFVTHYKGADWLIELVEKVRAQEDFRGIRLILAGGKAYSLRGRDYYDAFYSSLKARLRNKPYIKITGFVPEGEVSTYFQAADLVVFPYRGFIGGSGALSYTLSFRKPFIMSEAMGEMLESHDIKSILARNGLDLRDVIFSSSSIQSFAKLVKRAKERRFRRKLMKVSSDLAEKRSSNVLIPSCYASLYTRNQELGQILTKSPFLSFSKNS